MRRSPLVTVLIVALVAMSAFLVRLQTAHAASNLPADKMTVSGSTTQVAAPNTTREIFAAKMKTSTVADLRFLITSECTILSSITNQGTSTAAYAAQVEVWVEIDGKPVSVVPPATTGGASSGGQGVDDGRVVFCNREFTRTTAFDSNNESIKDIERTSQANAFAWTALNVGNGIHDIRVYAHFTDTNGADTFAHGVINRRTLTVDTTNYFISQPSA
jgi:hypothetical protein